MFVGEHLLNELTEDGERRLAALTELPRAEMDAGVLSAHPCSTHKAGRYTDEPSIGMIVAGARLATKLGIGIEGTDVVPKATRRSGQTAHQHPLHEVGRTIGNGLLLFLVCLINQVAVPVFDALHEKRYVIATIVGHRTIAVDKLQKIDLAASEHHRARLLQLALNAHCIGSLGDIVYAALHAHAHSHRVEAHGKGTLERNLFVGEISVGIVRSPHFGFTCNGIDESDVGVRTMVDGIESLVHGLGIDKELEGGTRLMDGTDVIDLPGTEVDVAHPGTDETRVRLNSHKACMQEAQHVADRVDGAHLSLHGAVVAEEPHLMGLAEVVVNGVGIAFELRVEVSAVW